MRNSSDTKLWVGGFVERTLFGGGDLLLGKKYPTLIQPARFF